MRRGGLQALVDSYPDLGLAPPPPTLCPLSHLRRTTENHPHPPTHPTMLTTHFLLSSSKPRAASGATTRCHQATNSCSNPLHLYTRHPPNIAHFLLSSSKPRGPTRCSETLVAAHVRDTLPAFCGICGCTSTTCTSALWCCCLQWMRGARAQGACSARRQGACKEQGRSLRRTTHKPTAVQLQLLNPKRP